MSAKVPVTLPEVVAVAGASCGKMAKPSPCWSAEEEVADLIIRPETAIGEELCSTVPNPCTTVLYPTHVLYVGRNEVH